jgi:long-chain acyl-CoA synthetase
MFERFRSLAKTNPDATALIDGATGAITSRGELLAKAETFAAQLVAAGMREGDALALQLPNSVDFVAAFLAALQLRLLVVPIDRDAADTEVARILGHFAVRGLISRQLAVGSRQETNRPAVPAATRLIKLTSGSTGAPKGIVTTEANLIADCENICTTMDIRADDLNLGAIPFSHSYGFSNLVTPLLLQGTPVVF